MGVKTILLEYQLQMSLGMCASASTCAFYYTDGLASGSLSSDTSGEFKLIFAFRYIASKILNLTTGKMFHAGKRPPFKTITTQTRKCSFQIC